MYVPPKQAFSEPERRQLARVYQLWTNNRVNGQDTEDSVMNELLTLKTHMRDVAIEYFGLQGIWVDIHAALVPEELVYETQNKDGSTVPFQGYSNMEQPKESEESTDALDPKISYSGYSVSELLSYIDIMHFQIDEGMREEKNIIKIATAVIALKIRFMEMLRIHAFRCQILFGNHLIRQMIFPGITSMKKIMSGEDIQRLGCSYFYPQFGELNITNMRERFDFQELMQMAGILSAMCVEKMKSNGYKTKEANRMRFKINSGLRLDDLIKFVIFYANYLKMDVRTFLTPLGPEINIVTEPYASSTVINDDVHLQLSDLAEVCTNEGIKMVFASDSVPKPEEVLWEEYVITHFSPNFASNPGYHRSFFEAAANLRLTDGMNIEDISEHDLEAEIIYYGKRDGQSKMHVYTIKELADAFSDLDDFYDPESVRKNPTNPLLWTKFSTTSIRYLMRRILPHYTKSVYRMRLIEICQSILTKGLNDEKMQLDILGRLKFSTDREKEQMNDFFRKMYNAGLQFDNFWEEIDGYSYDSLANVVLENPLYVAPPETYTGRIAAKCRDILMYVEQELQANPELYVLIARLYITKFVSNIESDDGSGSAYIYYEEPYRIGNYMRLMYDFAKYNLIRSLIEAGKTMKMTAIYYQRQLSDVAIGDINVIFTETNTDYEKYVPVNEESWTN